MSKACPVCGSGETVGSVSREQLPVLQNRVYSTREEAINAPCAAFRLDTCSGCGFSFNGLFDANLVVYDEHYDNDVPSPTFKAYYDDLARMLISRFDLSSGTVYDLGCGKGDFLRRLCHFAPDVKGVGIDPSCAPNSEGNFTLIRDTFQPGSFALDAKLILLRHVLEHIEQPVVFAAAIAEAMRGAALYVEVPDANWIFNNGAFWDFCYEHCNYFTPSALAYALRRAGFEPEEQKAAFGGQYQWIICRPSSQSVPSPPGGDVSVEDARRYQAGEEELIRFARGQVGGADVSVIWGMATKGVIFSTLIGEASVAGGIDVNAKKQGCFVPGSGIKVHDPNWLRSVGDKATVFIMNGNYVEEIRRQISDMGSLVRTVVL